MTIEKVESLFQHTVAVREKYIELMKVTGERFNIFQILNVSSFEVELHSALLSELLSPHGNHGCGSVFLDSFLNLQKLKTQKEDFISNVNDFVVKDCIVKVEYHIGFKNADATEGGRIDILVKDRTGRHIIIENKIYAGDQEGQLVRYHNFDNNAPIFYLTLTGEEPSISSRGHLVRDTDYVCISYKEDITQWLELCVKEAVRLPLLRETIQQYIYLIKSLTGQTTNKNMEEEISNLLLKNDDYLDAAFTLSNNVTAVKVERAMEIKGLLESKLIDRNIACSISEHYNKFPRVEFYPLGWQNHLIGYTDANGLMFGIKRKVEKIKPVSFEQVKLRIGNDWKTSSWWLCYKANNTGIFNIFSPSPWLKKNQEALTNEMLERVVFFIESTKELAL